MEVGELQESLAYQPPAAVIALQQQLNVDWFNFTDLYPRAFGSSAANYKYRGVFTSTVDAPFPLVRVLCGSGQNLSADATTAEFPLISEYATATQGSNFQWASYGRSASIANLNRNLSTDVRAQWVALSRKTFGPISAGLLVAVRCSFQAAWYNGTSTSSSGESNYAWFVQQYSATYSGLPYIPLADSTALILDSSWLKALTPTVPDTSHSKSFDSPTTLEEIINATGISQVLSNYVTTQPIRSINDTCVSSWFPAGTTQTQMWNSSDCNKGDKRILLQALLAVVVADGLSRYNSILAFKPTSTLSTLTLATFPPSPSYSSLLIGVGNDDAVPPPADYPTRVYKLRAFFSITGYAYYASSTTDHLSTAVLVLYVLVAIMHLVWVCMSTYKWTSSAWATVTDLVALCTNSPPTSALRGTSAGITSATTYARVAQLRVSHSHPAGQDEDERVVLLFGAEDNVDGGWTSEEGQYEMDIINDPPVRTSLEEGLLYRRRYLDAEEGVEEKEVPGRRSRPLRGLWCLIRGLRASREQTLSNGRTQTGA
ncbi:hypothetical protein MMC22_008239 [Lobaria immixta]|nr:hypothetical protein [Lobaria immixta]